ncbi:MAG: FAD-dependent oxidoreductase [Actinomycetota bacterium]
MAKPPHLLILGGGFVARKAVSKLRRQIKRGDLTVTVVDRDNYLTIHALIGEMVTGRILPSTILNSNRRVFDPAQMYVGEIESVDTEAKKVIVSRSSDGVREELDYDYLLVSMGTGENLEAYPGLAEHAFRLKSFDDCFRLKNHLVEMFELADIEKDPEERRRLLTFFVAGGGFSGTELAGELANLVEKLTEGEYSGIKREECRVVVVHPGPTLLPELYGSKNAERSVKSYPKLVNYGMKHARKLGVELMLETRVAGATPNEVYLSNGEHIPTRTIVSTVGSKPWPLLDQLEFPKDGRGRLVTDEFLRVDGRLDVWAGGDCASVPYPKGGTCPPVALFALKHGAQIGRNIGRMLADRSLKPYRSDVIGQGISLGKRTAVGAMKGVAMGGFLSWVTWRMIVWSMAVPTWDRRLRLLADWTIWPLVGRDIVQMGASERAAYDVRHHVYQAGQTISDSDRPVRLVHVIVEGDVEIVRTANGSEELVQTIGAGDHFGRKMLEHKKADIARAKSLVRTLALQESQANQLQDMLVSTERIVARTTVTPAIDMDSLKGAGES